MTLDLSTLKVGDRVVAKTPLSTGAVMEVIAVHPSGCAVIEPDGNLAIIKARWANEYDVVVPPPPCPITEPIELRYCPFAPGYAWTDHPRCVEGRRLASPITVHPFVEGDVDDAGPYMKARWTP